MKLTANIENWEVIRLGDFEHLIGRINNHNRQHEFKTSIQMTSRLKKLDRTNKIAETENTIYFLGEENG